MLKRKMTEYLREWRKNHTNSCLLINGARQVGKSFVVEAFGKSDYQSYISIDFIKRPDLVDIFKGSLAAEDIYSKISLFIDDAQFVEGDTLIFIDEIQECPEARTAFKYLAQDGRYDVIGSGSLLGVRFKELENAPSLPVGYEQQVTMYSLDFEEFLWALGFNESAVAIMRGYYERRETLPQGVNEKWMRMLREYFAVGGMPTVVQAFVAQRNFKDADIEQRKLHNLYLDDVAKYAPSNVRIKARACYASMPAQLSKENTRFQYSLVKKGSSARNFENAVDWLIESNLVLKCCKVSTPLFPLAAYEEHSIFRMYVSDPGMLMAMYDFSLKAAVVENKLTGPMKGGLYENFVASMLARKNIPLRYWMTQDSRNEIEFFLEEDAAIVPIEVKASKGSTVSLDKVLKKPEIKKGYKLIDGNVGQVGKKITLPLYMAMFL